MTRYRLQISNDYSDGAQYFCAGPFQNPADGESPQQINIIDEDCHKNTASLSSHDIQRFIDKIKETIQNSKHKDSFRYKLSLLSDKNYVFIFIKDVGKHDNGELFFRPDNINIMEIAHIDEEAVGKFTMNRLYLMNINDIPSNPVIIFKNSHVSKIISLSLSDENIQIFEE